jgi:hypothetical protein
VLLGSAVLFFSLKPLRTIQGSWINDLLVFYAVIIIGMIGIRSHSVFFGMHVVFGAFIFALMQVLLLRNIPPEDQPTRLVRLEPSRRKLVSAFFLALLVLGAVSPPNSFFTAAQDKEERFVNQTITSVVLSHCSKETSCNEMLQEGRGPGVFVGTISALDAGVINWYFWTEGLTKSAKGVSFFPGEQILLEPPALDADYIVLLGEDNLYKGNPAFKATAMQEEWRLELKQKSSWNLISNSSLYFIFAKSNERHSLKGIEGP